MLYFLLFFFVKETYVLMSFFTSHIPQLNYSNNVFSRSAKEIVHRKKMGFSFPFDSWIRNELKQFCEERIISLSKRSFLNGSYILERWKRYLNNDPSTRWPDIWIGVVLENWLLENNIQS